MKKLIFLLLLPAVASADPGPATRYLINEPASLLDVGLLRAQEYLDGKRIVLENQLKEQGAENAFVLATANYDFENDLISIGYSILLDTSVVRKTCHVVLSDREVMLLKPLLFAWFSHRGEYVSTDRPEDFHNSLATRVEVSCGDGKTRGVKGKRKLDGDKTYWTGGDPE